MRLGTLPYYFHLYILITSYEKTLKRQWVTTGDSADGAGIRERRSRKGAETGTEAHVDDLLCAKPVVCFFIILTEIAFRCNYLEAQIY